MMPVMSAGLPARDITKTEIASVLVNEVKGGCNPAPLNRHVKDGKVVIQIEDILAGKQYFNFTGKAAS